MYYKHESSFIDENCTIGDFTNIWHFSHIQEGANIGENCTIGQNVNIGENVIIGDNVKIQNNVSVYEGVEIEDNVFLGPSCVFTNVLFPRAIQNGKFKKTLVEKGATIGANATIRCGIKIGESAFIGAGAVVLNDVPAFSMVAGNPAKKIGSVTEKGKVWNSQG